MRTKNRVLLSTGALAAVMLAAGCVAPPPPGNPPGTTTTTTIPTASSCPAASDGTAGPNSGTPVAGSWGVDGTPLASTVIGNVVYVGGLFNNAVSPGGAMVARHNLAAFCLANGQLLNTFVADTNGQVNALATDNTSLYVGGNFTTLNGVASNRLLKLSASNAARDPFFAPLPIPAPTANPPAVPPDGVLALAYSGGVIYAVGDFNKVGTGAGANQSTIVDNGAGFNAGTGALTAFTAGADKRVESVAVSPDGQSVYIGGSFTTVHGAARSQLAKLNTSGAVEPVAFGSVGTRPRDIAVSSDNTRIFAAGGPAVPAQSGTGHRLLSFSATTGAKSLDDTNPRGDAEAVEFVPGAPNRAFFGMLNGYVTNSGPELVGVDFSKPTSDPGYLLWQTPSVSTTGVYDLAQGSGYFVAVGDFTTMGGIGGLHGLAIFV